MKTTEELKNYISLLLNTLEVELNDSFMQNVEIIKIVLIAYRLGLEKKPFEIEIFLRELKLEKEIPPQFHILVAQLSAIKSGDVKTNAIDYIFRNVSELLNKYRIFFEK